VLARDEEAELVQHLGPTVGVKVGDEIGGRLLEERIMDLGGHYEVVLLHVRDASGLLNGGWREPMLVESGDERGVVVPLAHSVVQDIQVLREVHAVVVLR
jgi:hypothetical protein